MEIFLRVKPTSNLCDCRLLSYLWSLRCILCFSNRATNGPTNWPCSTSFPAQRGEIPWPKCLHGNGDNGNTAVMEMDSTEWMLSLSMVYLPAWPHVSLNRLFYLNCCWTVQWLWLLMLCFVLFACMCLYLQRKFEIDLYIHLYSPHSGRNK